MALAGRAYDTHAGDSRRFKIGLRCEGNLPVGMSVHKVGVLHPEAAERNSDELAR
jgi:hypothetical protein